MHYLWESSQGTQREVNSDAGVIFQNQQVLVSALVDGAEGKQRGGNEFANFWANCIVRESANYVTSRPPNQRQDSAVIELLIHNHRFLRHQFLLHKASYVLLILNKISGEFTTFHCGDCLEGLLNDVGVIEWIINPHNCAIQLEQMGERNCDAYRHTLTRCLNARRFIKPEINHHQLTLGRRIILASDGFCFNERTDDASSLILDPEQGHNSINSDCDNFISTKSR